MTPRRRLLVRATRTASAAAGLAAAPGWLRDEKWGPVIRKAGLKAG